MSDANDNPTQWPKHRIGDGSTSQNTEAPTTAKHLGIELDLESDKETYSNILRLDGEVKMIILVVPTKDQQYALVDEATMEILYVSPSVQTVLYIGEAFQQGFAVGYNQRDHEATCPHHNNTAPDREEEHSGD